MQFKTSFAVLLASILFAAPQLGVEAAPNPTRRSTGAITLPLRRVERSKADIHPLINLQQNINRGNRRLARMSGRELPSDEELADKLWRRIVAIEDAERLSKRYSRHGVPKTSKGKGTTLKGNKANALEGHKQKQQGQNSTATAHGQQGAGKGLGKGAGNGANNNTDVGAQGDGTGAGAGKGVDHGSGNGNGKAVGQGNDKGNGKGVGNGIGNGANNGTDVGANGNGANNGTDIGAAGNGPNNGTDIGTSQGAGNGTTAADTPDGVTAANQPSTPNSLGLDIEGHDVSYLSTIQIGNPPRDFILLMDSGSADMWVGSENCQSEAGGGCGNHNFLGPNSSNSFKTGQQSFQVTYGTGAVAGTVVQDDVSIAGLALPGHTFGVADQESVDFSDDSVPFDGIMGLAKSTLSEEQTLTPIEALAKAGLVPAAITSFKIPRLDDGKNDGEVTFGALDTTKFDQQTLVTVDNVNPDGFWEANMDAIKVDGQDTSLQGRTAILDTGTTLIIAPEQDAVAVHQLIQGSQSDGQGGFTVPCTTNASITLSFGGTEFAIDPRDIAFQPLDPRNPSGDCVSGIAGGNIGGANEWLVGDVFLKNAYFSTDVGKNTLSLAKLV